MSRICLSKMFLVAMAKLTHNRSAGLTAQVTVLNHLGQIKAGKAPELDYHIAHSVQACQAGRKDPSPFC